MANLISHPLHEKFHPKNTLQRGFHLIILSLLLSLLLYRFLSLNNHGFTWLLAFLCESWFTFIWVLTINIKWNPGQYKTYPDCLLQRVPELPPVDMFVTTADPVLEPPIITVNTVLSLLAVDYPANKLACYVSDDGCSSLTFYSLVEASKFAKLWVPFCKKYSIQTRAPFRYFASESELSGDNSSEFKQEWKRMKEEYVQLSWKIEATVQKSMPFDLTREFDVFSNIESRNHPSIIKVIWENKEGLPNGLPHLVYISREKRPKHPHHFKAGAMNVLTRISGVMTNAPFMLNVDCDMFANNPQTVLHAMCLLLGIRNQSESAFVQFPQIFYDGLKDDPFGNLFIVLQETMSRGMVGIRGPIYTGTGCFHRRKIIYGLSPDEMDGNFTDKGLDKSFGNSMEFVKSAAQTFSGLNLKANCPNDLSISLEEAHGVAGCGYEYGTSWGTKVGWMYGSAAEDNLTGMKIHERGWKSIYCTPDCPAFLGCAPSCAPTTMTQQKRWTTGLLENLIISKHSPFISTLSGKLQFRQCLAYACFQVWGLRSIPELCYAALPAYCIITNSNFLPKVEEPAIFIPVSLFVIYNLCTLSEYIQTGQSIRAWWNNQRMGRIFSTSSWLFGLLSFISKLLGLSETVFEVTQKDQSSSSDDAVTIDAGRFTFDESPMFLPGTTVVMVHITALVIGLLRFQASTDHYGSGIGEIFFSVWVLLIFAPFVKGLFGKGKYGIPTSIIWKSATLALLFICLCIGTSFG